MNLSVAGLMGLKTISPVELHQAARERRVAVIDVNACSSWMEARVPGAKNLDAAGFAEGDLPADKGSTLVFYCSNPMCSKAPRAARRAREMGYHEVRVMSEGIRGWLAAGLPTESGA